MQWEQPLEYAALSDVGFRRQNNQDSVAVQLCESAEQWETRGHLLAVADGMGGHSAGELASKITTDTLPHTFFKTPNLDRVAALKHAIETANATVHERGATDKGFDQMGTTCSVLVLSPEGAAIGHVGDSRVYRIREEVIEQLTFDHSLQWELVRQGHLTPEEAEATQPKNVITRSLGPDPTVEVDLEGPYPVRAGDVYVLCSDGLTGHVHDSEIGMIAGSLAPAAACRMLVNLANLRGGSDNISVIVGRIGPGLGTTGSSRAGRGDGGLTWMQFLSVCLATAGFVGGVSLALTRDRVVGLSMAVLSVIIGIGLLLKWRRERPPQAEPVTTRVGDPYVTQPANLSPEFLGQMLDLGDEMAGHAQQELWPLPQQKLQKATEEVARLKSTADSGPLFHAAAQRIDALMTGLKKHRKRQGMS